MVVPDTVLVLDDCSRPVRREDVMNQPLDSPSPRSVQIHLPWLPMFDGHTLPVQTLGAGGRDIARGCDRELKKDNKAVATGDDAKRQQTRKKDDGEDAPIMLENW